MPKFRKISNAKGQYTFWCEGCECYHMVWTEIEEQGGNPVWKFNGDLDNPTVSPSILVREPSPAGMKICHSFIKDGKIQYLGDCTHKLAGKTIEIKDFDNT